ncbi:MAG: hypothetical protein Q8M54_08995 [Desulfobaccales bacterium]|nr:hypothetical protein [Desulfobaccales bacterium]
MTKLKVFLLLLLGILLTLFARENWHYPQPAVKLFGFDLLPLPQSLIIYGCLLLGFFSGWLAHALKIRKQKRAAAAPKPASTPE